jgi:hypothetical protein
LKRNAATEPKNHLSLALLSIITILRPLGRNLNEHLNLDRSSRAKHRPRSHVSRSRASCLDRIDHMRRGVWDPTYMDSYDSDSSVEPPLPESLLSRRKKAIVAISMAVFVNQLDTWLDNKVQPTQRGKRARGGDDDDDRDSAYGEDVGSPARQQQQQQQQQQQPGGNKNKRAKREVVKSGGQKLFACPFCKHDPDKYKTVKTCCGPGWGDIHRVKYVNVPFNHWTCLPACECNADLQWQGARLPPALAQGRLQPLFRAV